MIWPFRKKHIDPTPRRKSWQTPTPRATTPPRDPNTRDPAPVFHVGDAVLLVGREQDAPRSVTHIEWHRHEARWCYRHTSLRRPKAKYSTAYWFEEQLIRARD